MKKHFLIIMLFTAGSMLISPAEFVCKGERIEKNSYTWGYARQYGSDYRIEKGSSTIAFVKKRGSQWAIETFSGSTLGYLDGNYIEKINGLTWANLSDAKNLCDGPDPVAAAIWILKELGQI